MDIFWGLGEGMKTEEVKKLMGIQEANSYVQRHRENVRVEMTWVNGYQDWVNRIDLKAEN